MNLSESTTIRGTAAQCIAAIADFDSYPEWQSAVSKVTVHSTAPDGHGKLVEFDIDLKIKTVNYSLNYDFSVPEVVSWTYAGGDIKDVAGSYTFTDADKDGCIEATYELDLDLGFPVPGFIRSRVQKESMRRSVAEVKKRVEAS